MINPPNLLAIVSVGISLLAFQNRDIMGRLYLSPYLIVHKKQWYRLITHAFVHADWLHLLFNMIALWSFGSYVYNTLTNITSIPETHFYTMYTGAILAAIISDLVRHRNNPYYGSLGASGGVSAIIFAAILLDPWTTILIFFIPCPGIIFGVIYLIYSNRMSKQTGSHINHDAHFYGAIFGILYPLLIDPTIYHRFYELLKHPHFLS